MEYGYFDSEVTGFDDSTGMPIFDRAQDAEFIADMFASIWGSGVYPNPSNNLQVLERDDTQFGVKVMPGRLWIQGRFGKEPEITNIEFEAASATAARIDLIVAELDKPNREITLKYVAGTPAATSTPPELVRTSDVYQICLAQCTVRRNATKVNQSDILDTRPNTALCGFVSGVIDQVDTQTLFNQYLAKIDELNALMEELGLNPPEGVMYQHVYDPTKSGVVVDAERLGGQLPEYYLPAGKLAAVTNGTITATGMADPQHAYWQNRSGWVHLSVWWIAQAGQGAAIAQINGGNGLPNSAITVKGMVRYKDSGEVAMGLYRIDANGQIVVTNGAGAMMSEGWLDVTIPAKNV